MSTKDYCYDIITSKKELDKQVVIDHLESLFKNTKRFGENSFKPDEKFPIDFGVAFLSRNHKQVCLDIKSRAKPVKRRIKTMLEAFTVADLRINDAIQLQKPAATDKVCDLDRFKNAKGEERWKTLEHNGPYFRQLDPNVVTENIDADLIYDGKRYPLTPKEKLVLSFFAKRIITEENSKKKYISNPQFIANYFTDLKTYLSPEHKKIFKDFKKFDFSLIVNEIKDRKIEKEEEKKRLREEKKAEKERERENAKKGVEVKFTAKQIREQAEKRKERVLKFEKKLNYSFAFVDGVKKTIRNSAVELPGLYVGAGDNMTNKGKIKGEYVPEDITINCTKGKEPTPPKGHRWGDIVHDNTANWTAQYRDKTTGKLKYILLSETGDLLKFEKARKLNKHIEEVDRRIEKLLHSKSGKDKQIGCALYFIKEYGIRVGNDCDEEEKCDSTEPVVGATTLMVQNVKCNEVKEGKSSKKYFIDLSFKGKDSVLFNNTLEVSERVYELMEKFTDGKKGKDKVFDLISSNDVNAYLKSIDKDFSAKVFRTRLASSIMHEGLKLLMEKYEDEEVDDKQKKRDFEEVNLKVALKLNHKKTLTDKAKESFEKEAEKLKEMKKEIKDEKDAKKRKKLEKDYEEKKANFENKDKLKDVALNTSRKNYIDPRIVKAWAEFVNFGGCKNEDENDDVEDEEKEEKEEINHCVGKLYPKAELQHFRWAIENDEFDEDWDYEDTELDCVVGEDLRPESEEEKPKEKAKEKPKERVKPKEKAKPKANEKANEKAKEKTKTKKVIKSPKTFKVNVKDLKKIDETSDRFKECVKEIAKKFGITKAEVRAEYNKLKK
jgi:DNA topoisomerase-1